MNVRTTTDNSRIIKYKIDQLGQLTVYSILSKINTEKSKLVTPDGLNKEIIVTNQFSAVPTTTRQTDDYFYQMLSLTTKEIPPHEISVYYRKLANKPNDFFEVKSRKLTV